MDKLFINKQTKNALLSETRCVEHFLLLQYQNIFDKTEKNSFCTYESPMISMIINRSILIIFSID
jgi:hypothetical protein